MSDISCCGTKCDECYCYGNMCSGCNASEGKVFHAPEGKACAIYECVINEKHFKNCSNCKEVPCSIWMATRDSKYTDEEFEHNVAYATRRRRRVSQAKLFFMKKSLCRNQ